MRLILLRHGESEWNLLNKFTGWTDVDLTEKGKKEAQEAGILLNRGGFDFDLLFEISISLSIDHSIRAIYYRFLF